ncbi:MAG: DNA helicase [Myxococcales bacterium]
MDAPFDIPAEAVAEHLLEGLNESQQEAVLAFDGPVLILAGAGTGKTRTITHKIAWLVRVRGLAPWNVLAMTFTNKAAGEMRERLGHLLGPDAADLHLGTFHRIGLQLLRRFTGLAGLASGFVIYDDGDQKTLIGRILKDLGITDAWPAQRYRGFIDRAKNHCWGPHSPELPRDSRFDEQAATVYAAYQERLRAANAVDFGDLIVEPIRLLESNPAALDELHYRWQYVLVDEFQDTNAAQHRLLRLLASDGVCVVGDDDQSIYRWRGAEIANILKFEDQYPGTTVVRLERNYRSTGTILAAAGAVIANNRRRHVKTLWTDADAGPPLTLYVATSERDEAEWVVRRVRALAKSEPLSEVAIFYRTNSQSRVFEDELRKERVPYVVVGGMRFYERAEIKDALAYLRLLVNPRDDIALLRAINTPARGIGPGTLDKVAERAGRDGEGLLAAALAMAGTKEGKRLAPFAALIADLREIYAQVPPPVVLCQRTLERSGLLEALRAEGSVEAESRLDNLRELLTSIEEYQTGAKDATLHGFLDQVALVSDVDEVEDTEDKVTLMTVHAAKGLEFNAVFVTGVEENLFPHFNSADDPDAIEEERRLCYVAMTRARRILTLSRAASRHRFGQTQENPPSRFLREIPPELVHVTDQAAQRRGATASLGLTGRPGASFQAGWRQRAQATEPPADAFPDYDSPQSTAPGAGTRVRHATLGAGRIVSIDGHGPEARVLVDFAGDRRKVIARFLTLA